MLACIASFVLLCVLCDLFSWESHFWKYHLNPVRSNVYMLFFSSLASRYCVVMIPFPTTTKLQESPPESVRSIAPRRWTSWRTCLPILPISLGRDTFSPFAPWREGSCPGTATQRPVSTWPTWRDDPAPEYCARLSPRSTPPRWCVYPKWSDFADITDWCWLALSISSSTVRTRKKYK